MKTVFVSSTFRDMQAERDMLNLDVLPALRARAGEYGESIDFIDLRWGVNTGNMSEEEANRKVLKVCLNNIDRAKPYMLILLGERYGWMPPRDLLDDASNEKGYNRKFSDESVTALEIEYGALAQEDLSNCIVCMREPLPEDEMDEASRRDYKAESSEHKIRLERIKSELKERLGNRIITYKVGWDSKKKRPCGLEELSKKLIERFTQLWEADWKSSRSREWQEVELRRSESFFEENRRRFSGRDDLLASYLADILGPSCNLFILEGETGSGKSGIMAMLAKMLSTHDCTVMPFACGNGAASVTAEDFVKQGVWYIENRLKSVEGLSDEGFSGERLSPLTGEEQQQPPEAWCERFSRLCEMYEQTELPPLIFMLDGLDKLTKTEILRTFAFLPKQMGDKIRFVVSCASGFEIPQVSAVEHSIRRLVPLLEDKAQVREVAEGILKHAHKGLNERVWTQLLQKTGTKNLLFTSILLWRLMIMDSDDLAAAKSGDALDDVMIDIISNSPDDLSGICRAVLQEAALRIQGDFAHTVLSLLAASRNGIRTSELERIFGVLGIEWSSLSFARFTRYLAPYFIWREDGRLDFAHRSIRESFEISDGETQSVHKAILSSLLELPDDDGIRRTEGFYHARMADDFPAFLTLLASMWPYSLDMERQRETIQAAQSVLALCMEDNGAWVSQGIERYKHEEAFCRASAFLGNVFSHATIYLSQKETQTGITVLMSAYTAAWIRYGSASKQDISEEEQLLLPVLAERIGSCWRRLGEERQAENYLKDAAEEFQKLYAYSPSSLNRSNYISSQYNLIQHYYKAQQYEKAYELLLELEEPCDQDFREEQSVQAVGRIASIRCLLAEVCHKLQKFTVGVKVAQSAVGLFEIYQSMTEDTAGISNIIDAREMLIEFLCIENRKTDAVAEQRKLCSNLEQMCRRMPDLSNTIHLALQTTKLYEWLCELNQMEEAVEAIQALSSLHRAIFDAAPTVANLSAMTAGCYLAGCRLSEAGRFEEAEEYLEDAVAGAQTLCAQQDDAQNRQRVEKYMQYLENVRKLLEQDVQSKKIDEKGSSDMDNNLAQAQKTFATFCKMMEAREWSFDKDEENLRIKTGVRGDDLAIHVNVAIDPERSLVLIYSPLEFNVPQEKMMDMALAVCIINNSLIDGSFDYDVAKGSLCFRMSMSFRESLISVETLDYMMSYTVYVVDEYNDKLLMLAKGMLSPQQLMESMNK
jgi:hypothetical protein